MTKDLFSQSLEWTLKGKACWTTEWNKNTFTLKMNDFPDQILYSLFDSNGKCFARIDDLPNTWSIEFDRD